MDALFVSEFRRRIHSTDIPEEPGFYPVIKMIEGDPSNLLLVIQVFNGVFWCRCDGTEISEVDNENLLAWGPVMTFRDASLARCRASEAFSLRAIAARSSHYLATPQP